MNRIDLLFRGSVNLDDNSTQFVANADYSVGDHVQLFLHSIVNSISRNGEFDRFLDYQLIKGLEYSF